MIVDAVRTTCRAIMNDTNSKVIRVEMGLALYRKFLGEIGGKSELKASITIEGVGRVDLIPKGLGTSIKFVTESGYEPIFASSGFGDFPGNLSGAASLCH